MGISVGKPNDTTFDYTLMVMNVFERFLAMLTHIGLTVIVYFDVINAKKSCLLLAILQLMLADTFPALYQRGLVPLWSVEIWGTLWTAVILLFAVMFYRKMADRTENDLNPN